MTIPIQEQRMLGNKIKGNLVAMAFMCECTRRGGVVSVPLADDHPYDVVVDNGGQLIRVQVKKSNCDSLGRWSCNTRKRKMNYASPVHATTFSDENGDDCRTQSCRIVPYLPGEIDCIVTCVANSWYFFTDIHLLRNNKWINPKRPDQTRDNWAAIGLPRQPIYGAD
jgi:hypothetical protein